MMSTSTSDAKLCPVADRPYHHGNLRAALLDQAEQTLREQGLEGLALRDLARQLGVSHGAPRRHFADRQALLDALAESGFARLGTELRAAAASAGEDYQARLHATSAAYVRFAITDAALLELMFARKHHEQAAALNEAADRAFSLILELIEEGQTSGLLEPGEPERIALLLFATMHGIAALATAGIVATDQVHDLAADAAERFLHGPNTRGRPSATGTRRRQPKAARVRQGSSVA
jgi:AcrR family transcriptional regulator